MIDPSKKYRTRDGREVRIYATDGDAQGFPVHGAIHDGEWLARSWTARGDFHLLGQESPFDLIEVRPRIKRTVWLSIYPAEFTCVDKTKEDAERASDKSCLARVKVEIDCEEGEGL